MRKKLNDTTSWNTLFLNPNSILAAIAKKFNIKKVFFVFLFIRVIFQIKNLKIWLLEQHKLRQKLYLKLNNGWKLKELTQIF